MVLLSDSFFGRKRLYFTHVSCIVNVHTYGYSHSVLLASWNQLLTWSPSLDWTLAAPSDPDPPVPVSGSHTTDTGPLPSCVTLTIRYLPFTLHSPLSLFVLLTQIVLGDPHLFFIAGVYTALFLTVLCRSTQWGRHLLGRDSQGFNQIFISTSVILLKEWYIDYWLFYR